MQYAQFNKLTEKLYSLCFETDSDAPYEAEDMFRDFKKAQKLMINSTIKIEDAIDALKANQTQRSLEKIWQLEEQLLVLKDFANSIAWMLLNGATNLRAHFGAGPNGAHLKDRNIDTSLRIIEKFKSVKHGMVFLTDLTTRVNIGDLLVAKKNSRPQIIELKEGEKNAFIFSLTYDDDAQEKYLATLTEKDRKVTERHLRRLNSQKKRIDMLTEYLKDGTKRYDEALNDEIHIHKPTKKLRTETYAKRVQKAHGKLPQFGAKILKITGGMYVMITNTPINDADIFYFQHYLYHQINHHSDRECMHKNRGFDQAQIEQEIINASKIPLYPGVQNLGGVGHDPTTLALTELGRNLALDLLSQKSTLYFYFNPPEFLDYLEKLGLNWDLRKGTNHRIQDKGTFKYEGKEVRIEKLLMVSNNFWERMICNFTTPKYEISIIKEELQAAKRLIAGISLNNT